jgi:2-polyprenyl-3-methyl-5-hydroxy-6-metoxy-1,4-benzoquinol methylase
MLFSSLRARNRQPELMDDPALDAASHRLALAGLARINRFSNSAGVLWPSLQKLATAIPDRPLRVLDVATGSGDVPLVLVQKAAQAGVKIEVVGLDLSQVAIAEAEVRAELGKHENLQFQVMDVLKQPLPEGFDAVICSLFVHHLDNADVVKLLKAMKHAAGRLVLVNDLSRSRGNYLQVWIASHLLSASHVVHTDGPRSVRAAFTPEEMKAFADAAGMTGAKVEGRWPCRMLMSWEKK